MRKCNICEAEITEGYVHEELAIYFCSDEHIEMQWSGIIAELNAMCDEELDESPIYWTSWED